MNRKTVLALALSSAFTFPVSIAYADGDGTKEEAPKPELIAQSDETKAPKPEFIAQSDETKAPKPEFIAQSDEKPETPKPELTADVGGPFPQGSSPELVADKNEAPYPTQSEFERVS
jgi:hypothetical protein